MYKGLYQGQSSDFKIISVDDLDKFLQQIENNNKYITDNIKPLQYNPSPKSMDIDWNFSKIPASEYNNILKAYEYKNIDYLFKIHNKYKVSNYKYCCNVSEPMLNWFGYGLSNNLIPNNNESTI